MSYEAATSDNLQLGIQLGLEPETTGEKKNKKIGKLCETH